MPKPAVNIPVRTASRVSANNGDDRRDAILLTTDFRPKIGGIAEYLGGLWTEAMGWGSAYVLSTVPGAEGFDAHTLPPPPERELGGRLGDRLPALRRVNTLAHFAALRRYARRTLAPVLARLDERSRVCIGIWNPLAHFWCDSLAAARQPYALFAYGLDVIQPLYGTVAPWRVRDFRGAARVLACSTGTAETLVERLGVERSSVRVVHPGIPMAGYVPPTSADVAVLRRRFGLTADRIRVIE